MHGKIVVEHWKSFLVLKKMHKYLKMPDCFIKELKL